MPPNKQQQKTPVKAVAKLEVKKASTTKFTKKAPTVVTYHGDGQITVAKAAQCVEFAQQGVTVKEKTKLKHISKKGNVKVTDTATREVERRLSHGDVAGLILQANKPAVGVARLQLEN